MNNLIVSSLSGRGSKGKGREGKGIYARDCTRASHASIIFANK